VVKWRSVFPLISNFINWKGDDYFLRSIAVPNLFLLIPIGFILAATWVWRRRFDGPTRAYLSSRPSYQLAALAALLLTVYRLPFPIHLVASGLDPSWEVGLSWAKLRDLHWGDDLAFTYGPYFWLLNATPILPQWTLLKVLLVNLAFHGVAMTVLLGGIVQALKQRQLSIPIAVLLVIALFLLEYNQADLAFAAALLVFSRVQEWSYRRFALIGAVVLLLALISLAKFGYTAASIGILVLYSVQMLLNRAYRLAILPPVLYGVLIVGLWLMAGQPMANLPHYFRYSIEITSGYSEAMSSPLWNDLGLRWHNITNLVFVLIAVVGLASLVAGNLLPIGRRGLFWPILLAGPILFLAFKEGFTRFDVYHQGLFYSQLATLLIPFILLAVSRNYRRSYSLLIAGALTLLFVFPFVPDYHSLRFFDQTTKRADLAGATASIRQNYKLGQPVIETINPGATTDIWPWDIALLYGYRLNWLPRPVFQSYSAYTSTLDSLNSRHFLSRQAPRQVLFSLECCMDRRYPIYDEPAVFASLLHQYQPATTARDSAKYLLLQNRVPVTPIRQDQLTSMNGTMNEEIDVPQTRDAHVYLKASVELTWLGKVANFLFKVPPLSITFHTTTTPPVQHRLIRQTARNGLFVSKYIAGLTDFEQVIREQYTPDIRQVVIAGNELFYEKQYAIVFVQSPFRKGAPSYTVLN